MSKKNKIILKALTIIFVGVLGLIFLIGTPIFTVITAFVLRDQIPYNILIALTIINALDLIVIILLITGGSKKVKKPSEETDKSWKQKILWY